MSKPLDAMPAENPEVKAPKYAPTPADADGLVPRVIKDIERAPAGLKRFKIRCLNYAPPTRPFKYVLARNEDEARKCYLDVTGIAKERDRVMRSKPKDGPQPEEPDLFVKALPD